MTVASECLKKQKYLERKSNKILHACRCGSTEVEKIKLKSEAMCEKHGISLERPLKSFALSWNFSLQMFEITRSWKSQLVLVLFRIKELLEEGEQFSIATNIRS